MVLIIDLSPNTLLETLLTEEVHGMAQVFITGPALMAPEDTFARLSGHRSCAGKTLKILSIATKAMTTTVGLFSVQRQVGNRINRGRDDAQRVLGCVCGIPGAEVQGKGAF